MTLFKTLKMILSETLRVILFKTLKMILSETLRVILLETLGMILFKNAEDDSGHAIIQKLSTQGIKSPTTAVSEFLHCFQYRPESKNKKKNSSWKHGSSSFSSVKMIVPRSVPNYGNRILSS